MNALNTMDQRLTKIELKYFERHADIQLKKYERARNRIVGKLQKHIAYKMVLKQHSIAKAKNYKKALDGNYSFQALHYEVNDMMHQIQPDVVRERRARALIDVNRQRYETLLRKNQENCAILFPMKKTWEAFDFTKIKTKGDKDDDEKSQGGESTVSPLPKIDPRRGKLAIRRRIIEEPESRPHSKSPSHVLSPSQSKSPALSKPNSSKSVTMNMSGIRQGITMNMMKKQKSFIENQEKITQIDESAVQGHQVGDISNETEHLNDRVLKSDDEKINATSDTTESTLTLPPIKPKQKQGVSKFMKPKGAGITSKFGNLSLNPKMSGVGMNPKLKLPSLKMKQGQPPREEIAAQG